MRFGRPLTVTEQNGEFMKALQMSETVKAVGLVNRPRDMKSISVTGGERCAEKEGLTSSRKQSGSLQSPEQVV